MGGGKKRHEKAERAKKHVGYLREKKGVPVRIRGHAPPVLCIEKKVWRGAQIEIISRKYGWNKEI